MKGILSLSKVVLVLIIVSLPELMLAHPGHGDHSHDGWSIIHYFTQPEHALVSIAIVLSLAVVVIVMKKSKARRA
ncbi:MAG TPA: hypothetical protein PLQ57_16005 [Saprospiraceae bacterium]|nr:hypothetical protein [Saprospiraceae bacterium]HRG22545.1 hypothetical protein [Saprospiraceae bacterium]HRG66733.1 hypothetical protein [Saprospiraceae bacterium]